MDPNLIQAILSQGQYDPEVEQAKRKQAMIDALRQRSMSSPRQQMAGRLVSPNYGDVASNLIGGWQAEKMQPGVDQTMQQAGQRQTQTRQGYYQALINALRRQQPQQLPGMVNPNPSVGMTPIDPQQFGTY